MIFPKNKILNLLVVQIYVGHVHILLSMRIEIAFDDYIISFYNRLTTFAAAYT
jgi:hypothetical protein